MRIAMVADEFYPAIGGAPVSTMELSKALAELGAEPVVITHVYPGFPTWEEMDGFEVRRLDGFVISRLDRAASPKLFYRLHQTIKHGNFDIVHAQDFYSPMSLLALFSAEKCKLPSLITCRSVHESTGLWRFLYLPLVFILRRAERIVALSKASEQFCHELGVPSNKTVVIPSGIDLSRFNPNVDGSPMRDRLGIGDEPLVVTAIRLVKRKGPQYLVLAFAKVLKTIPNANLAIAGSGPEAENLRDQMRDLGIEKSAFLVGSLSREKVAELMSAADVFVLPSEIEALNRAVREAAAIGTPVVCPRVGGMPETIVDGFNGLMFRPRDIDSMAHAILRVLMDAQLSERLRENGLKMAPNFSSERTGRQTLSLYEEICEKYA